MSENKYSVKTNAGQQDGSFNYTEFFSFLWGLRFWIIGFGLAALVIGYVYVKFQTPMFERKTQIMLVDEKTGGSNELVLLSEITGSQQGSQIDNEVFILRSPSLMSKVVEDLNLNYRYYSYSVPRNIFMSKFAKSLLSVRKQEFYNDAPFELILGFDEKYPQRVLPGSMSVEFTVAEDDRIRISEVIENGVSLRVDKNWTEEQKLVSLGSPVVRNGYSFTIAGKNSISLKPGNRYKAVWTKPYSLGAALSKNLKVMVENGVQGRTSRTNVITMTMQDSKIARADDILNMITVKYMEETKNFKDKSVLATIDFIDKRLNAISKELGNVESDYKNYQRNNTLVNIDAQSQLTLTSDMEYDKQLTDIRLQQQILRMIMQELDAMPQGRYEVIPSNIGLTDAGLNQVINSYNTMVAERNRLVANSSENNPRVRNVDLQLADGRNNIVLSIQNLDKIYSIRASEIQNALRASKSRMSSIPVQQFDLAQIERQQQIIEPLYLLLQQKREEAQISMYAVAENVRVIEPAYGSSAPISPKKMQIYLLALIIGCCLVPAYVLIKNMLRITVQTKEDIEKRLNVPVLTTIPKSDNSKDLVSVFSRDLKSESFRMLRSSLKFIPGKVIQITSSIPSEGKTFVAANLAVSISHAGNRVLVVGLDLRKPALVSYFNELKVDKEHSVVGYLIGKCKSPAETIITAKDKYGVDVVFSGSVPPNPSELLSTDKVNELLEYYRSQYDYVILDTAPMMPVSDSILINRFVDVTLYVLRSEYTALKALDEIAKLLEGSNIKTPYLVLNDVDLHSKRLRYGYGYGYGKRYGYGRGYGYGYGKGYGYGYGYGADSDNSGKKKHHRHKSSEGKAEETVTGADGNKDI